MRKSQGVALVIAFAALSLGLSGCASTASLDGDNDWLISAQPKGTNPVQGKLTQRFGDTTFGQYAFKVERAGAETFYGRLPLQFQQQRVYWDILFPPLYLFNLRAVYPYYAFDPDAGVVRYRTSELEPWQSHTPDTKEIRRAKSYFREAW
jgi:hypothetical protein